LDLLRARQVADQVRFIQAFQAWAQNGNHHHRKSRGVWDFVDTSAFCK
jgi:hypothetical protein